MDYYYGSNTLSVQLYDVMETVLRATDHEIAFYASRAAGVATPILEIGVGTGRLAWPLAAMGYTVVGVDRSAAMLERAMAKRSGYPEEIRQRIDFVQADMADLDLGRRFDLILLPFRAFNSLATGAEQERFLRTANRHLSDAGRLLIDQFVPSPSMLEPGAQAPSSAPITFNFKDSPHRIERTLQDFTVDHARQQLVFHILYRVLLEDTLLREQRLIYPTYWTTPEQMEALLESAGLVVVSRESSSFSPKEPYDDILWTIGRR